MAGACAAVSRWGYYRVTGVAVLSLCWLSSPANGSDAARRETVRGAVKKVLTPEAYDRWKQITGPELSGDGQWVAYTLSSPLGEGELVVRATRGQKEFRVSRGNVSAHHPSSRGGDFAPAKITSDSRFVLFTIAGDTSDGSTPPVSMGILSLPRGEVVRVPGVSSFVLPRQSGRYVAYQQGGALILRDLAGGTIVQIPEVSDFVFDEGSRYLAYVVRGTQSSGAQNSTIERVWVRRLADGQTTLLLVADEVRSVTFDRSGSQFAFLARQAGSVTAPAYAVYYAASPTQAARAVVRPAELPSGLQISPDRGVQFTKAGNALTFGIAKVPVPASSSTSAVQLDIWRWNDPVPQSEQALYAERDRRQSYLAVYHLETGRWAQLENEAVSKVLLSEDARYGVGIDQQPYRIANTWGEYVSDLYRIDPRTGSSRLLRRGLRTFRDPQRYLSTLILSPSGRYLLYMENRRWFSYDLERDVLSDLTGALAGVSFVGQDGIGRGPAASLGIAGWTAQDRQVLLYTQNDVWEVDPAGAGVPRNLTRGVGQAQHLMFRIWPHLASYVYTVTPQPPLEEPLDIGRPLLLTAYDLEAHRASLWRVSPKGAPRLLVKADPPVRLLARAVHAEQYLATREDFAVFPDLWTGERLERLRQISHANPQQSEYRWGKGELIRWTSRFGAPLAGVLFTPEDLDPTRKYPLIVELYGPRFLHTYTSPRLETATSLSLPVALSRGYVVLHADARVGEPYLGEGGLASIEPGVEAVLRHRFLDPARVAVMGFSAGGYMVNYLITHTTLFRCALSGGAVTDLLSNYSDIYGASGAAPPGLIRSGQFERGTYMQGRSIWEDPLVYLSGSPILFADRVRTPLLILHNENDNAVPFSQGRELYVALRRNGREAYLLNYNQEGHGLVQYQDQLDFERRTYEFLDHFLKDAPVPGWMEHGVPYLEKGRGAGSAPGPHPAAGS